MQNFDENNLLQNIKNPNTPYELRESSLCDLSKHYTLQQQPEKLEQLLDLAKVLAPGDSKIYLAKLLNLILDTVSKNDTTKKQLESKICHQILNWSIEEKKQFLINKLRLRYANILYQRGEYRKARKENDLVLKDAKDIDDKKLLVECHLLESRLIYESHNLTKAKASLIACRASSNMVYVSPLLQAEIEMTAGTIHLAEKDYQIAYSYFYEAFEGFNQNKRKDQARKLFAYLVMTKIMNDQTQEAKNLIDGRYGLVYGNSDEMNKFMQKIVHAYEGKNLVELNEYLLDNKSLIESNRIVSSQIDFLYDQLLEKNILKLIKPYSKIQTSFMSEKLGVDENVLEKKICEMILDEKLNGSLDQENGIFLIFEDIQLDPLYTDSLDILTNMDQALDELFKRAKKIQIKQ